MLPQQHQNLEASENGISDPLLVTLGMCILDDLYLPNGTSKLGILGGSGVFCMFVFFPAFPVLQYT
jgi:hypothetical protein